MTITAQRLLTELGQRAWSGFNADDMVFSSEDSLQARAELNAAIRYLVNLEDFPFRSKEKTVRVSSNQPNYNGLDGQITCIYDADTLEQLTFIGNNESMDKTLVGKPTGYWIDYKNPNEKIRLYPIPDNAYNLKVVYNQYKPVLNADGETSFEFQSADDFINMPENLEYLFMDCLVLRTIVTNNKDEQDENYQPTINEFNEAWRVFKRACKPAKLENRVVW